MLRLAWSLALLSALLIGCTVIWVGGDGANSIRVAKEVDVKPSDETIVAKKIKVNRGESE